MHRKSIRIGDVEISYTVNSEAEDLTVFLFHGNSSSSLIWDAQFVDPILSKYRLIAFDLPGHGFSATIPAKDYSILNMARLMAIAVKALSRGNYVLIGFSLGGNIVAEMLNYNVNPCGIIFLSTGLVGKEILLSQVISSEIVSQVLFNTNCDYKIVEKYFNDLPANPNQVLVDSLLKDYFNTCQEFREFFPLSISQGLYSDELELVRGCGCLPMAIFGEEDNIVNPDLLNHVKINWWGNMIHKINNAKHLVNIDSTDQVNYLIHQYIESCNHR